ncbi:MAG TPA: Gmad2 immunoglobulin-like domain-containing protein, partial [Sporichthyaceae bacterium]
AAVERDHGDRGTDLVLPAAPVTTTPTATATASPTASTGPTGCPSMDPSLLPGCHVTATGVPKDTGGEYISITSPQSGGVVHHTFTVSGRARVFESQFTVDVSQNGMVIKTAHVTASAGAPELGTWSTTFTLPDGNYRIDAYELSPKGDGSKVASDTVWIQAGSPPGPPQATAATSSANAR